MKARAARMQRRFRRRIQKRGEPVLIQHVTGKTRPPGGGAITPTTVNISTKAVIGPAVAGFLAGMRIMSDKTQVILGAPLLDSAGAARIPKPGDTLYRSADTSGEKLTLGKVARYPLAGIDLLYAPEIEG